MRRRDRNLWLLAAAAGGLAYPFLVYAGLVYAETSFLKPSLLVLIALFLIGLRLLALPKAGPRHWLIGLALAALVLIALLALNPGLAVKAYPVVISLTAAGIFGGSLIWPPTVAERFARLRYPEPPPEVIAYTRGVTKLWFGYLLANAAVAATLGLWGSLQQWTLWTGLISHLLTGTLFLGELAWRHHVRLHA